MMGLHNIVSLFGRLSFLVDENTAALHFFITALLNLFDRAGWMYGEIARLVLGIIGFRGFRKAVGGGGNGAKMIGPPGGAAAADNAHGVVQHNRGYSNPTHAGPSRAAAAAAANLNRGDLDSAWSRSQ